ncbi:MAG: hypothetical protein RJA70_529 [Pseudomonadota bacterium]
MRREISPRGEGLLSACCERFFFEGTKGLILAWNFICERSGALRYS